jgi:hypothetical protein
LILSGASRPGDADPWFDRESSLFKGSVPQQHDRAESHCCAPGPINLHHRPDAAAVSALLAEGASGHGKNVLVILRFVFW